MRNNWIWKAADKVLNWSWYPNIPASGPIFDTRAARFAKDKIYPRATRRQMPRSAQIKQENNEEETVKTLNYRGLYAGVKFALVGK
jgi:hypothetical protein